MEIQARVKFWFSKVCFISASLWCYVEHASNNLPRARLRWSDVWSLPGLTFADLESFHNLQHFVPQLDIASDSESILVLMVEVVTRGGDLKMYINISYGWKS